MVFLLQGYLHTGRAVRDERDEMIEFLTELRWKTSGSRINFSTLQALVRTLYVSGVVAMADTLLKIFYIYGLHVPLFLYG